VAPKSIALAIILFVAGMAGTVVLVFTKRFDAFLAYVALSLIVTAAMVKLVQPPWLKWMVGIVSLIAFWEMGHIDEFLGEREHRELCEKYARVTVYKKAELPAEFYNEDGMPNFLSGNGPDWKRLKKYIGFKFENAIIVSDEYLRIEERAFLITDARSDDVLARKIDFYAWPSSFIPTIAHTRAKVCVYQDEKLWQDMYRGVFNK